MNEWFSVVETHNWWKHNGVLQPILHVLWALAMQLPVGVLKDMISSYMHSHVLFPQALIQPLQLLAEVPVKMDRKEKYQ